MTIKVHVWQKYGISTDHVIEEYEFCCWQSLFDWMKRFSLHQCPDCKKKESQNPKPEAGK